MIDVAGLERFRGKTVLELNPGPGLLAERILQKVKPKRYVALEFRQPFLAALATLQDTVPAQQNTEVIVRHADGFQWSTYSDLATEGVLDVNELTADRADLNPNLVFIGTARTLQTEQLLAQWLDTLGTNSWIQQYGRVQMYLFLPRHLRQKLLAPLGSPMRTKSTLIREATCHVREISHSPFIQNPLHEGRITFQEVFDDLPQNPESVYARPDQYYPWSPISLLEFSPYNTRKIGASWETFEFVVKTLLMNRSTPLHRQIRTMASGAYVILKDLPADLRKKWPQDMTVEEMDLIAQAFDAWPFKPRFLNIVTAEMPENQRSKKYGRMIRSQTDVFNASFDSAEAVLTEEALLDDDDDDNAASRPSL